MYVFYYKKIFNSVISLSLVAKSMYQIILNLVKMTREWFLNEVLFRSSELLVFLQHFLQCKIAAAGVPHYVGS